MLIVDKYETLNALLKLFWTVKFDIPTENSIEFISSPFIAEIYKETYQANINLLQKDFRDGDAKRLEDELVGPHTFEIMSVEKHIEFLKKEWLDWKLDRKKEFVRLLMSPFVISEGDIDEIIKRHS